MSLWTAQPGYMCSYGPHRQGTCVFVDRTVRVLVDRTVRHWEDIAECSMNSTGRTVQTVLWAALGGQCRMFYEQHWEDSADCSMGGQCRMFYGRTVQNVLWAALGGQCRLFCGQHWEDMDWLAPFQMTV
ncbi:hypothetical protein ACOMHN_064131 [Nucella lapillus]